MSQVSPESQRTVFGAFSVFRRWMSKRDKSETKTSNGLQILEMDRVGKFRASSQLGFQLSSSASS